MTTVQTDTIYTVKELLDALGIARRAKKAVGRGLTIGGLNIASLEQTIRIPDGTTSLLVIIPGAEPMEIGL